MPQIGAPFPNLGVESHVHGWRSHAICPARETLRPDRPAAIRQPQGDDRAGRSRLRPGHSLPGRGPPVPAHPGPHPGIGHAGRQRDPGPEAAGGRDRAAAGLRRGWAAGPPPAHPGAGRGERRQHLRPGGRPTRAARGRGRVLDSPRHADQARPAWSAARAARRCCSGCCWPSARTSPSRSPAGSATPPRPACSGCRRTSCRCRRARAALRGRGPGGHGDRGPRAGRRIGAVVATLPDNPTGRLARPASVHALCQVAAEHDLIIIAGEIYRDLVHDPDQAFASPVLFAPERTVVTTALSKSLALGGWRIGVARLPDSGIGLALRDRLVGIGSEIWSAPSLPIQHAASLAFDEPAELTERVAAAGPCTRRWPRWWPTGSPPPGCWCPHRRPRSTCIPISRPGASTCAAPAASATVPTWPRTCCTATAWACCPRARSARSRRRCGCGWPPRCSTARPTSSASGPCAPMTR